MATGFSERLASLNEVTNRAVAIRQKFRRALGDIRGIASEVASVQQQYAAVLADVEAAAQGPSATAADINLAASASRLLVEAQSVTTLANSASSALTGIEV